MELYISSALNLKMLQEFSVGISLKAIACSTDIIANSENGS